MTHLCSVNNVIVISPCLLLMSCIALTANEYWRISQTYDRSSHILVVAGRPAAQAAHSIDVEALVRAAEHRRDIERARGARCARLPCGRRLWRGAAAAARGLDPAGAAARSCRGR